MCGSSPSRRQDRPRGRGALVDETDEELLLISAAGQVVRTDVQSVSRSSAARGVIVMRLNEGDEVAGIAVFRAGLAEQRGDGPNDADGPGADGPGATGPPRDGTTAGGQPRDSFGTVPASGDRDAGPVRGQRQPQLARKIGLYLGRDLGTCRGLRVRQREHLRKILDNVREHDVYLVQPTCSPVQKSIMELLIMIDAFKRASAGRITAVVPYYAYGRSDKKDQPGCPSRPGSSRT